MTETKFVLIGNSFPFSHIRRPVRISPMSLEDFKREAQGTLSVYSFWGHLNTLKAAEAFTGVELAPRTERPVIQLQESGLPQLYGRAFCECWILSANYIENFRPAPGEEVCANRIESWQILKITWEND